MISEVKLELKKQCEVITSYLKDSYPNQLRFNGILKDIYDKFIVLQKKVKNDESLKSISIHGCIRMFVDETTDYSSPIIKEMEKAGELLKKWQ
ncbi:hypothetical protein WMZ97_06130 [Lentibacillus sp. N15]|uniref:hypothetical protein n=1 Tax=Lentibacillus songyuanensis TaxID=3136161 RepID=UPI0031BAE61D